MIRVATAVFAASFVTACAWQSEALKVGDDVYEVSASASPARGGTAGARKIAMTNATKHCNMLAKSIDVVAIQAEDAVPASGFATVTFRCK